MAYSTDAARWRALTIRDANANGHFVYSVRSTNCYCRPICPARLARRANVGFYKTALQAEADGFRACKRCKPNSVLEDPQERAVEKACALIVEALKNNDPKAFRLQDLAKNVGLTPRYFHKIFKDKTGVTPKEWAKARATPGNNLDATPALTDSPNGTPPSESAEYDLLDWNSLLFNELVDFDIDGGATLGYNLVTGASKPVSMGYGNAIDMNIMNELWNPEYDFGGMGVGSSTGDNLANELDVSIPAMAWPAIEKEIPVTSSELYVNTLWTCDNVLF
ncbi:metal binding domain of Ada-domain-containing protein [Phaeosphaeria sp. MPI-PUGE-AT-0046c]|nr:metal binding domain of Ada-domain-containing protein [Phaeosphaeria sp. MPI-PUGE-AT-0046c]